MALLWLTKRRRGMQFMRTALVGAVLASFALGGAGLAMAQPAGKDGPLTKWHKVQEQRAKDGDASKAARKVPKEAKRT